MPSIVPSFNPSCGCCGRALTGFCCGLYTQVGWKKKQNTINHLVHSLLCSLIEFQQPYWVTKNFYLDEIPSFNIINQLSTFTLRLCGHPGRCSCGLTVWQSVTTKTWCVIKVQILQPTAPSLYPVISSLVNKDSYNNEQNRPSGIQ